MSISGETKDLIENYNNAYKKILLCVYQISTALDDNQKFDFHKYNDLLGTIKPAIESSILMRKIVESMNSPNICIRRDIARHYSISERISVLTELNNHIWKIGSIIFQMQNSRFDYLGQDMNLLDFYKRIEKTRILKKADAPKIEDLKERYAAVHVLINELDDHIRFAREIYKNHHTLVNFSGQERLDLEMLFIDEDEKLKTIKIGDQKMDYWDVHFDIKKIGAVAKRFQEFLEHEKNSVKEEFARDEPGIHVLEKELEWVGTNHKLLGMLLSSFHEDLPKLVKEFDRIELLKKGEVDISDRNKRLLTKSGEIIKDIESAFSVLRQSASYKSNFNNLRILLDSRTELFVDESKIILGKLS